MNTSPLTRRTFRRNLVAGVALAAVLASSPGAAKPAAKASGQQAVSFTDARDDAYGMSGVVGSPPNALLSDPAADIIASRYGPASRPRSYAVSMTVAGRIDSGYNYIVAGEFSGGDCDLYHFLPQGGTAMANAWCGAGESRRLVGVLPGGPASVSSDGTTISAVFDARNLPDGLSGERTLRDLSSSTCKEGAESLGCRPEEKLDRSKTDQSYRL